MQKIGSLNPHRNTYSKNEDEEQMKLLQNVINNSKNQQISFPLQVISHNWNRKQSKLPLKIQATWTHVAETSPKTSCYGKKNITGN